MRKQNERGHGKPEKPQWMVTSFAACTALGLLYGRYILGPSISSLQEGIVIGLSIGVGSGVSIGAILEVGKNPETTEKKHNKLLILVVASTTLLVLLTFLYL
ncbi:TPA: hypothetical protein HA351_12635 [Methanosarcinaceae archaeon]|nr:hypothetical protein [Methanosarcinaceae archaeon]